MPRAAFRCAANCHRTSCGITSRCQTNRAASKRLLETQIPRPSKIDMLRTLSSAAGTKAAAKQRTPTCPSKFPGSWQPRKFIWTVRGLCK
jgi:hypothetical protein